MSIDLTFAPSGLPCQARFVLVNDRVLRAGHHCALCGGIVEKSYVRDSQTRLIYCDTQCFAGAARITMPGIKHRERNAPSHRSFHFSAPYMLSLSPSRATWPRGSSIRSTQRPRFDPDFGLPLACLYRDNRWHQLLLWIPNRLQEKPLEVGRCTPHFLCSRQISHEGVAAIS